MTPAADALLDALVDYAGLFPPAGLDMAPAADLYAEHRAGPDAFLLGRFIVPATHLGELAEEVHRLGGTRWPLSVLGLAPQGDGADAWLDAAQKTLQTARDAEAQHDGLLNAERFELKLPAPLARDPDTLAGLLGDLDAAYLDGASVGPRAALEVPYLDDPETVEPAAQAVSDANGRAGRPAFALKLRCGGVTPDLVPEAEALARAIHHVIRGGAAFKATAGLHHPLPNDDEAVGTRMHGFLGVFGGAALARLHGLGPDDLAEILVDADPASWSVEDGLRWRSLRMSAAEVADARQQLALSFGSCSFAEPRDDLRALGWI
ncbi:hypothetical protein [Rubrivirga marina]|uniref:Uncharacterized protein n=1 Tax=Rubrivirga marina TaxID=1196024 RepID=A0A271IZS0_9BACT|nr:hypothetical protein [Rubrivirga marina]PAP76736.1 hypothetical protein BSZ37_09955 [Rubrivirga marina]